MSNMGRVVARHTSPLKVIYLAHPVSDDIPGNLDRGRAWVLWAETNYPVVVMSNWLYEVEIYPAAGPGDPVYEQALLRDFEVLKRCDEVWLCGGYVSDGMRREIDVAMMHRIPVKDLTRLGTTPPEGKSEYFHQA